MKSSQALTQSVFANLIALGKLDLLAGLDDEDGGFVFFERAPEPRDVQLEYPVDHLGEPRRTSVDVFVRGSHPVAIECKLAETEIGACSRPRLLSSEPNFERDHCDGSYTIQRGRRDRCSLTAIGVRYWECASELFCWPADQDLDPCPLRFTYQLVRKRSRRTTWRVRGGDPWGCRSDGRAMPCWSMTRARGVVLQRADDALPGAAAQPSRSYNPARAARHARSTAPSGAKARRPHRKPTRKVCAVEGENAARDTAG
jgi:hypothetical protein